MAKLAFKQPIARAVQSLVGVVAAAAISASCANAGDKDVSSSPLTWYDDPWSYQARRADSIAWDALADDLDGEMRDRVEDGRFSYVRLEREPDRDRLLVVYPDELGEAAALVIELNLRQRESFRAHFVSVSDGNGLLFLTGEVIAKLLETSPQLAEEISSAVTLPEELRLELVSALDVDASDVSIGTRHNKTLVIRTPQEHSVPITLEQASALRSILEGALAQSRSSFGTSVPTRVWREYASDLRIGQCVELSAEYLTEESVLAFPVAPCDSARASGRVVDIVFMPRRDTAAFPTSEEFEEFALANCPHDVARLVYLFPTEDTWITGDRVVTCIERTD
jgi:hypothetical protein